MAAYSLVLEYSTVSDFPTQKLLRSVCPTLLVHGELLSRRFDSVQSCEVQHVFVNFRAGNKARVDVISIEEHPHRWQFHINVGRS